VKEKQSIEFKGDKVIINTVTHTGVRDDVLGSPIPKDSIVIDVGCKQGYWWADILDEVREGLFKICIDPMDSLPEGFYADNTHAVEYFKCAVGIEDKDEVTFYDLAEPGCNSLLKPTPQLEAVLGPAGLSEIPQEIKVKQRRLDTILDGINFPFEVNEIFYLKTDCQGADLSVVKSMGDYLKKTKYIEMEVTLDPTEDEPHTFYLEQDNNVNEVINQLHEIGNFEVVDFLPFPASPFPEGMILFKQQ